jgi:hypothetical protein
VIFVTLGETAATRLGGCAAKIKNGLRFWVAASCGNPGEGDVGDERQVQLSALADGLVSTEGMVQFIANHAAANTVVAVDASLVVRELSQRGFVHDFDIATAKQMGGRWLFEVYPHPAGRTHLAATLPRAYG